MKQKNSFGSFICNLTKLQNRRNVKTGKKNALRGNRRNSQTSRILRLESLEERQLLSVTTVEYDQIRNDYSAFHLSENINENNIIELTSLSATNLQNAIHQAAQTEQNDLIVIRTSEINNCIDLKGETLYINIDSTAQGVLNIIGFGDSMLRLYNENLNVIHIESGQVNLGGLNLTTKADSTQLKNVLLSQGENADVLTQRVLFSSNYTVDSNGTFNSNNAIKTKSSTVTSSFGTAKMPDVVDTNYYSAEFQLSGSQWIYLTGLSQFEAQDIQNNVYNGTNDFYVGEFYDAEKDGAPDSNLCWAGTASNMLAYTGWGDVIGNEDDIFDYFRENFTNDGSRTEFGIEWFMNGSYPAEGWSGWAQVVGTGGNLHPNYDYDLYCKSIDSAYYYINTSYSPLYAIDQYLRDGCAIGLSISWVTDDSELESLGGHAITMWGFVYDDTKIVGDTDYYLSVIVSDSDDDVDFSSYTNVGRNAPNRLQTYGVTWRENEMIYEFDSYGRGTWSIGVIEDFQYLYVTEVSQKPELGPYAPTYWSGPIVVTNSEDSTTSNLFLRTEDNIYICYSIANYGGLDITEPFECTLTISGATLTQPIILQDVISGLESNYYHPSQSELGSLPEGTYTVTLTIDSTNVVDEEYENNNTVTYSFFVIDNPAISLVVDSLEDIIDITDDKSTLREAIAFAEPGDTITFASSLNGQTITLSGEELEITKGITIDASALSNGITINADYESRVFNISDGSYDPIVLNGLTITGGYTTDDGGGIYINEGYVTLNECTISGNYTDNEGGGIYDYWATLIMTNCTVSGNYAWAGGGIFNYDYLTMTNCVVSDNVASYGAGILNSYYLTMTNSIVSENYADASGGGVYNSYKATILNTLISDNTAYWGGGLINFSESKLTNCTIAGNNAEGGEDYGGGIANAEYLTLYNSIVTQNTAEGSSNDIAILYDEDYEPFIGARNTLSSFTDWDAGSDNYVYDTTKPLFTNASNGDYTLATNSQAIDKGNNTYAIDAYENPLQYDLAGKTRIVNNIVDLGAYEYQQQEPNPLIVDSLEDTINATDGKTTLREAIALAQSGETIIFKSSLNGQTITLSGTQLEIDKAITIDASALSNGITIDADAKSRVFYISGGTEASPINLLGLTITGGDASYTENDVETDVYGGGIYLEEGVLTLTNSTITDNFAFYDGSGIYNYEGVLTMTNCTVSENFALTNGGGIYNDFGTLTLTNCTISESNKAVEGAGLYNNEGTLTVTDCTIENNEAEFSGGGIYNNGTLTMMNSTVAGNYSIWDGSGIFNYSGGTVTLTDCTISDNYALVTGGGIYNMMNLSMTNCIVSNNYAYSEGGGVYNCDTGSLIMTNCTISENVGDYIGGGVYNDGLLTLTNSLVIGNSVTESFYGGGGIYNEGTLTLANSTVTGNSAEGEDDCGGGITNVSTLKIYNSIVAHNTAEGSSNDIYNAEEGTVNAYNTLSSYTAWDAGSDNLVYDSTKPLFTDAANGDYTLVENSQAIDKGNNTYAVDAEGNPLLYDLAGNARIANNIVDLGAYEYLQSHPLIVDSLADTIDATDGKTTLREAIANAQDGDTITFVSSLNGKTITLSGTELEITKDITIDASALSNGIIIDGDRESGVFYVSVASASSSVNLLGLTITGGSGGDGGGIYIDVGTLTLTNCTISGNWASFGGGISNNIGTTVTLTNCTISDNGASYGAGIYNNEGSLIILTNCTISGGWASGEGGGIYNYYGNMSLTNCTITGNSADNGTGGIDNYEGILIMSNCTVSENIGYLSGGIGSVLGDLTLTNCKLTGNSTDSDGGGIYNSLGTLTMTNCTVSGNSAHHGAGISNNATLTLKNTIVALNTAMVSENDIYNAEEGTVNAYNTLSSYTAWDAGSDNYVYDTTKPLFTNAANGDYTLAANSQAIDKGDNTYAVDAEGNPLLYDLAGNARIVNNIVDLGAYEYQQQPISLIVDSLEDTINATDGKTTLREAIANAQDGDTITFNSSLNGQTITLSGTQLVIDKAITIDASALSNGITISADEKSRVFYISGGTATNPVQLINLSVTKGKIVGGGSYEGGGGIYVNNSYLFMEKCNVSSNTILGNNFFHGAGMYIYSSTVTMNNCVIANNSGTTTFGISCGGIYNHYESILTMTNCTVSDNSLEFGGGIDNSGTLTITNSIVSGNSASYSGGGIFNSGTLTMTNCTVAGNSANYGGGIYQSSDDSDSVLTLMNTIVNSNYSKKEAKNINGVLSETSVNNLVGYIPGFVSEPVFDDNGLLTNADTIDLHLRSYSSAIDAGNNTAAANITTDLDGNPRLYNGTVDIGAYEYQGDRNDPSPYYSSVVNTLNDSFDLTDNEWSLREAIYWMSEYTTITFADDLAGTITLTLGQLNIDRGLAIYGDNRISLDANKNSRAIYVNVEALNTPVVDHSKQ